METTETELKFLYLAFDLIILNLILIFLYSISSLDISVRNLYFLHANMSEIIAYSMFSKKNLYFHDNFLNRVKQMVKRLEIFVVVIFVLAHLFLPRDFSRLFLIEYIALFIVAKLIYYYLVYTFLKFRRSKGFFVHRVLIVDLNEMGIFLRNILINNPMYGCEFIGYVSEGNTDNKEVLGSMDELEQLVSEHQIDLLFITDCKYNDLKRSKELVSTCNKIGVRLRFVPENQYWFKSGVDMESIGSLVVFNPQEIPLDSMKSRFFKRSFDVCFSLMVIVFIFSWLFPILYILIKLSSKGPVFFVQERTGINKKTFKCLKFRSMCINDDADTKQATLGDSRVTSLGYFLRKSNIDEFPQFFNVLIGQMSVVGPRPHMLKHTDQYSKLIDYYLVRHYAKPGITGWAQVNGYRGTTDELWKMQKRVEYDMYYLNHWTFWWDIKIIFMTVFGKNGHKNAC